MSAFPVLGLLLLPLAIGSVDMVGRIELFWMPVTQRPGSQKIL